MPSNDNSNNGFHAQILGTLKAIDRRLGHVEEDLLEVKAGVGYLRERAKRHDERLDRLEDAAGLPSGGTS